MRYVCRGLLLASAALACRDGTDLPTGPVESVAPAPAATKAPLSFSMVSVGGNHTCGVTTDNRAYCWGQNFFGELGDGSTTSRLVPVAVAGGLRFVQLSAGYQHTCGVTTTDRVYCWGDASEGAIGDGSSKYFPFVENRLTPVLVAGNRRYRQVRAGSFHTCALTTADLAFCWGNNEKGQVGNSGAHNFTPARVIGGLHFRRIIAGGLHTCGATTDDHGYCWGDNTDGAVGNGSTIDRSKPVAVGGSLKFRAVLAGGGDFGDEQHQSSDAEHSCGVTQENVVYCWGNNQYGQLGNGALHGFHPTPERIGGNLRFIDVTPGSYHTCGLTLSGEAYCWGVGGILGDGTTATRPSPVPVAGSMHFRGISAGPHAFHSCGVTTDRRAYCWGGNSSGQIGDGTQFTDRLTPVAVAPPM